MSDRFGHLLEEPVDNEPVLAESFNPIDLAGVLDGTIEQPVPTMLFRHGDGIRSGLIYPGMVNGLHGDSGTGKSWTAVLLIAERLAANETVMLIDLEDTAASIVSRLRLIGVSDPAILDGLIYLRPTEPFGPIEVNHLVSLIGNRDVTAVVIDSLGEAFGTEGINEDRDNEVGPWLRGVARVLAAAGPAVVLIDHSTKSSEQQLHASGSKRKRAAIGGASYLVEVKTGFAKGENGRLKLTCAKDRHGTYRRGDHVAWLDMTTHPDDTVTLELLAPAPADAEESPDEKIRRKLIELLATEKRPMSKSAVGAGLREIGLKAGNVPIDQKIARMVHLGELIEEPGSRNAKMLSLPTDETTS